MTTINTGAATESVPLYESGLLAINIAPETADEELQKIASRICYKSGIAGLFSFVLSALQTQRHSQVLARRLQALETKIAKLDHTPPHMASAETR